MPYSTSRALSKAGGRAVNQDATGTTTSEGLGCWVLADGLGGHAAGDVASRAAVDAVLDSFRGGPDLTEASLSGYVLAAQNAVHTLQRSRYEFASMKTTITVLVTSDDAARWVHVGDSRLYAFHSGRVAARTNDHSVPQALVETGKISDEAIRTHPERNRLLRALGQPGEPKPEIGPEFNVVSGDAFLLCSDGFWEYVLEPEMENALQAARNPDAWLDDMERLLLARVPPGNDNYSALGVLKS